ncbi:hypothetical protein [Moraxella sp. ZY200743]|uniref:hypothetical protein n=1 Tax=Moraxella sp. ZY200743 TaxID=2911970 RepID=UPI003D7EC7CC
MNNLPQIHIESPAHLVEVISTLATGSFENRYGSKPLNSVIATFGFVTQDLTQLQMNIGIAKMVEMGFCPDAALFRRWCLGLNGFDNSDAIADSYIGKNAALANILAWLDNPKTKITLAQKQAYDAVYHMFRDIHSDYDKNHAYAAFKDHYEFIVQALVSDRKPCQYYEPPVTLQAPQDAPQAHIAVPNERAKEFIAGIFGKIYKNPKNSKTMGLSA